MNSFGHKKSIKSRVMKLGMILALPFIFIIITYAAYNLFLVPDPLVEGIDAFSILPAEKTIQFKGKNLNSIHIVIHQGSTSRELLKDTPASNDKTYTVKIKPEDLGLEDGPATVLIKGRAGFFKEVEYELNTIIDTVPPAIELLHAPFTMYQGTGGLALFRAKDADSVYIKLEDYKFSAFNLSPDRGSKTEANRDDVHKSVYLAFFTAPFESSAESVLYAVARDTAGNQDIIALPTKLKTKIFKSSSISIDDSFINTVVSSLLNETDISEPVRAFKKVNEEWRKSILSRLVEIARDTESKTLWNGRFLQLKNSKVMATYGDKRFYLYKGEIISKSVHLGYDLASVTNASVEAANSGVIRFAEDLGIYGNTVIIDHGLGLMSLYGHLSVIMVKEGQTVKKGEIIAKTGSTGLAGGDHLHFGILIHGHEVSPLHWWDPNWIKVTVLKYLEQQVK